uniref:Uncharacterized protein n=1 Tax=Anguilla anguilla TaxID=7936 RepID=A0A0E9QH02_ANGAN
MALGLSVPQHCRPSEMANALGPAVFTYPPKKGRRDGGRKRLAIYVNINTAEVITYKSLRFPEF